MIWAAKHYGVHAHGITLSQAQLDEARPRIAAEGLQDRITVELRDYRALQGEGVYDKVSSVGMFEHVGLANLPQYHATVHRVLKPNGLFLNHGITHEEDGWQPSRRHRVHQPLRVPGRRARSRQHHPGRHGGGALRDPGCREPAHALRTDAAPLGEPPRVAPRRGTRT